MGFAELGLHNITCSQVKKKSGLLITFTCVTALTLGTAAWLSCHSLHRLKVRYCLRMVAAVALTDGEDSAVAVAETAAAAGGGAVAETAAAAGGGGAVAVAETAAAAAGGGAVAVAETAAAAAAGDVAPTVAGSSAAVAPTVAAADAIADARPPCPDSPCAEPLVPDEGGPALEIPGAGILVHRPLEAALQDRLA